MPSDRIYGTLAYGPAKGGGRGLWALAVEPHLAIRLKRLFPRAMPSRDGAIILSDTPDVARDLEWVMERWPLAVDGATQKHLAGQATRHRDTEAAVDRILLGGQRLSGLHEPRRPARDYQLEAADLALSSGHGLLVVDDVGLGKTTTSLCILRDPRALPALVVTLTHLPEQWLREIQHWFPWLTGHVVTSTQPYDVAARQPDGQPPNVLIMNYHKLAGWADHLAGRVKAVIFDEIQELRHHTSQKYAAAGRVADAADFKCGLSASPIYNYGGEIHSVVSVLAPDVLGSRDEFAREWGVGYDRKLSVRDPQALAAYLKDLGVMLRRTRKDVGRELPELQRIVYPVDLDEQVLSGLEDEALELAQLLLSAESPVADRWRAAGELDWRLRHATGVAKAPFVADFVRMLLESEERVVLFGWHRQCYDIWEERLGDLRPAFYTGSETPTQKARSADAFIRGDSRVLIMSLRSGLGLDGLQDVASVAVLGELDWSPAVHSQCFGRLHRDGQRKPVVGFIPLAQSGADPVMAEVNGVKAMQASGFVDPDGEPFEETTNSQERIRMLALDVLRRRGITPKAPEHHEVKGAA